jgi:hypothetical protein
MSDVCSDREFTYRIEIVGLRLDIGAMRFPTTKTDPEALRGKY